MATPVPTSISVLSSGCVSKRVCVCMRAGRMSVRLCLGRGWEAQKNICTEAYHHDVTLLISVTSHQTTCFVDAQFYNSDEHFQQHVVLKSGNRMNK